MSRRKLSVFDRLGPGNDSETMPSHPTPTRHRHYSSDKHNERLLITPEERLRDKHISDPERPRKRHHNVDEATPTDTRPSSLKREKISISQRELKEREKERQFPRPEKSKHHRSSTSYSSTEGGESDGEDKDKKKGVGLQSHPKRTKTVRGASDKRDSVGEPRDVSQHHYRLEEQHRTKRKRERDSLSDSEQRDSKRQRNEVTEKHSHKESGRDKKDRKESGTSEDDVGHQQKRPSRKHKRQSESEADNDVVKSDLDWVSLARLTRPKLPLSSNCLNDHKSGPILASLGLSPTLAGPKLAEQVHRVVKEHLASKYGNLLPKSLLDNPFGGCGLASASVSHLQDEIKESQVCHNIGSCRRALTAQADFTLRKKLRKCEEKLSTGYSSSPGTSWPDYYAASVLLYQKPID